MVDIETEREMSRSAVAEYLRTFADELDAHTGSTDGTETNGRTGNGDQQRNGGSREDTDVRRDKDVDTIEDSESDSREASSADSETNTSEGGYATETERRSRGAESSYSSRGDSNRADLSGGRVTFMVGNESTTINPPDDLTFEVSVDSESALIGTGTGRTARFALHWDEADVEDENDLSIR
ncbi:hypothetical protein BRC86_12125 [Halobacteriales archaeon QS_3_64_16]|nr:MAG: hypothetical protein BRC86_12125 [Halobacteriales archaeon QS_3_64_16]